MHPVPAGLGLGAILQNALLHPMGTANNKERREGTNGGTRNALKQSIYVF